MLSSTDASVEPKSPSHDADGGGDDRLSALPDELLRAILSRLKAQQTAQTCVLATRWRHLWRTVTYFDSDGLSALPDELLLAILSRLKAQQTVQTCVLATRWRHLWRSVPRLDIDEWDWDYAWKPSYSNLLRCHHVSLLEDLRLHVDYPLPFDQWVSRAVGLDDASTSFQPCRLKRLHLFNLVEINLTDLATHISSRCPALEDVELESCGFFLTGNAKIASLSLKKLSLIGGFFNVYDDGEVFPLIIEAPALVSLQLGDELHHFVDETEPHTMPSLVDAMVHLRYSEEAVKPQLSILGALSNVTTLHLSHFEVKLLFYEGHEDLPEFKFDNLRSLILDTCCISNDFLGLCQYLHNSPNLHKLTLIDCNVRPGKEMMDRLGSYSEDLRHFKCNNLRVSEIMYNDGDDYVHLLVKFLVAAWWNLRNNKIQLTPHT